MLFKLWPRTDTVWVTFETLTLGTWQLSLASLSQWIDSNQRGPLIPENSLNSEYQLTLLSLWLCFSAIRFFLYVPLSQGYPVHFEGGRFLRLPHYYCDPFQLLTTFPVYCYLACGSCNAYCAISTFQLRLARYINPKVPSISCNNNNKRNDNKSPKSSSSYHHHHHSKDCATNSNRIG